MNTLKEICAAIPKVENSELEKAIIDHINDLTKPIGSLGRLEECALQYALCRADKAATIRSSSIYTFAADHGITAEGVAPFPKEVTKQMVLNMCHGGAAISVMCKNAGINYAVVDMGVDADFSDHPLLKKRSVMRGTRNFLHETAMSAGECEQAIMAGVQIAHDCDSDLVGIGEMGIGNTSSASALYSMLLGMSGESTVGAGTGANGDLLTHKKKIIAQAVQFHKTSWDGSAFDALRRVGGLEIAGMVGLILGNAMRRVPTVVDGFIASAAGLVAMRMASGLKPFLIFAHESAEQFHQKFLKSESIRPLLTLDMRLGEGTGAALAMQIIMQAMNCYNQMATFSSAGVSGKA